MRLLLDRVLKVRQSREQILVSSILPKNEHWDNFQYIEFLIFGNLGHHNVLSRFTDLRYIVKDAKIMK